VLVLSTKIGCIAGVTFTDFLIDRLEAKAEKCVPKYLILELYDYATLNI
jgi:hypothetical protein